MCHFLSFVVTKKRGEIRCGIDLDSHEEIADGWNLKPGSYREAEWTGEEPESLVVRTEPEGDHDENFYRAMVLGVYPTRSKLLKAIKEGRGKDGAKATFKNGKLHSYRGRPAGIRVDGSKFWLKDGKLHRDGDKPAVIEADGSKEWWKDGKLIR